MIAPEAVTPTALLSPPHLGSSYLEGFSAIPTSHLTESGARELTVFGWHSFTGLSISSGGKNSGSFSIYIHICTHK